MTTTARILGRHLTPLTDGETAERSQWIWWQIDKLVVAAASLAGHPFAVATECVMARLGERGEPATLNDLLGQHARVAEPVH